MLRARILLGIHHGFNNNGPALREAGVVRGEDRDHGDRLRGRLHRFTPLQRQVGLLSLQREHHEMLYRYHAVDLHSTSFPELGK